MLPTEFLAKGPRLSRGFRAMRLALPAKAKKINPVSSNLETGFLGNLLCQVFQAAQIRVDHFFAPRAYQMGVRVRFVAVIPVASIRKGYFQHLVDLFKEMDRFIYRGDTGRRELLPNDFINPFHRGMPITGRQYSENRHPLGGNPKIVIPQLCKHLV
jgi:hypothetical protein